MIFCKRCKRRLTNPKSKRRGYGPVCWKKIKRKPKPLVWRLGGSK